MYNRRKKVPPPPLVRHSSKRERSSGSGRPKKTEKQAKAFFFDIRKYRRDHDRHLPIQSTHIESTKSASVAAAVAGKYNFFLVCTHVKHISSFTLTTSHTKVLSLLLFLKPFPSARKMQCTLASLSPSLALFSMYC